MVPLEPEATVRLVDGFVDLLRERVVREDRAVALSTREAQLFAYLAARPGEAVGRDELLKEVWEYRASRPTRAVDLTMTRLRKKVEPDPSAPVHLVSIYGEGYRFVEAGARPAPPPPPSAVSPAEDPFIGRVRALGELRDALGDARLVTLLGPGGVGKTRLAREHAATWPGPARFCDLSSADDLLGVVQGVAAALGVPLTGASDAASLVSRVGHAVAALGPALVVVDNVEQVAEAAAGAVRTWLSLAPEARIVATSRERLRVSGERVVEVEPLSEDDGIALLCERAAAVGGAWERDDEALRDVVRRLDGLPLALELAASRARTLTPRALRDRLAERFDLLRSARRDRPTRHATLAAALDWSWDLLSDEERRMLGWLSVFRGGFELEAVEEVCDTGGTWPLDLLDQLRDRSLVAARGHRFHLLETVGEYAARRLEEGGEAALAAERHAAWFAAEGERLVAGLRGPAAVERRGALERERANLLAAHARTTDPELRARISLVLNALIVHAGPRGSLRPLLDAALAAGPALPAALRARLLAASSGEHEMKRHGDEAVADGLAAVQAARGEAARVRAEAHMRLGRALHWCRRHEEAVGHKRRAVELFEEAGDVGWQARVTLSLGESQRAVGRFDEAWVTGARAVALCRRVGDRSGLGLGLAALARIATKQGRQEEAAALVDEAIAHVRAIEDPGRLASVLGMYAAVVSEARGRFDEAADRLGEAAALHRQLGNRAEAAYVSIDLANLLLECGRPEEARSHLAEARSLAAGGASVDLYGKGPVRLHFADLLDGIALLDLGRPREGLALVRRGTAACVEVGTAVAASWAELHLGMALLFVGEPGEAEAALTRALPAAEAAGEDEPRMLVLAMRAAARAVRGGAWEEDLAAAGDALGLAPLVAALGRREPLPAVELRMPVSIGVTGSELARAARVLRRLFEG